MKTTLISLALLVAVPASFANKISEGDQMDVWYPKYKDQENIPPLDKMLVLTDKEPNINQKGFKSIFNGKNLDGWVSYGGECTFEVVDGTIEATTIPGSQSTYLSTVKDDYTDFVFTCEVRWLVDGNTGVQFRSKVRKGNKVENDVYGPQFELEEKSRARGWSGGIYGQSDGGYLYPLWLDAHKEARDAVNYDGWNRVTIQARGMNMKTWINGIPAAHVRSKKYMDGFFSLQSHSGQQGKVQFRNIKVKEFPKKK